MNESISAPVVSPLRQRLIDDMNMRRFSPETQRNYLRDVGRFATFVVRSSDLIHQIFLLSRRLPISTEDDHRR